MRDVPCLLFVHIPKTAGTSFRNGAAKVLGQDNCQFDYGRNSPDTTDLVREHVYAVPDLYRLGAELRATGSRLLAGHFDLPRYGALFRTDQVLSFCRDPAQQLLSHFAHAVRLNGYRGDLAQFLASGDGGGRQSRAFGHFPLEVLGFIGVTERYEESLRVVREAYGVDIEPLVHNTNPDRDGEARYVVPDDVADAYAAASARDADVHAKANRLLDQRLLALDGGYRYVHGMIQGANQYAVRGFAFDGSDEPVAVELEVNGTTVDRLASAGDRPGLRAMGVPRLGFIGFDFHLRRLLEDGDNVLVRVEGTGQVLGELVFGQARDKAQHTGSTK